MYKDKSLDDGFLSNEDGVNLSFTGCGFLGIYHVGVVAALKTYAPHLTINKVCGCSAGAMAAVCLVAGAPMQDLTNDILSASLEGRKHFGGPFSPYFSVCKLIDRGLKKALSNDVHKKVSKKLFISLTKVYDGTNYLVSDFRSKKEVIETVIASSFIPIFSGLIPYRYRGSPVIDGGFSVNQPVLNGKTITISPFSGDATICPLDDRETGGWESHRVFLAKAGTDITLKNILRLRHVLFPPPPEVLARLCKNGFDDTLRFLQQNTLISCTRCLFVSASYKEHAKPHNHDSDNCEDCIQRRQSASKGSVPDKIMELFEDTMLTADAELNKRSGIYRSISTIVTYIPLIDTARWCLEYVAKVVDWIISRCKNEEKVKWAFERLLGHMLTKLTQHGEVVVVSSADFACDINIVQFGHDDIALISDAGSGEVHASPLLTRRLSPNQSETDILSLGIRSLLENSEEQEFPTNSGEARRFQAENLTVAVNSTAGAGCAAFPSRRASLAVSRLNTQVSSGLGSRRASRHASRRNSVTSIQSLSASAANAPETFDKIMDFTDKKDTVLELFYTNKDNEVVTMALYDVTNADPADFIGEESDTDIASNSDGLPFSPTEIHAKLFQAELDEDDTHKDVINEKFGNFNDSSYTSENEAESENIREDSSAPESAKHHVTFNIDVTPKNKDT